VHVGRPATANAVEVGSGVESLPHPAARSIAARALATPVVDSRKKLVV